MSAILLLLIFCFGLSVKTTQAQTMNLKDSDYDSLTDQTESAVYHTNPHNGDTDADGWLDATEILTGTDPLNANDPVTITAPTSSAATTTSLPWYITRAAALSAYILMFLVIILGTGMTTGYVYKYSNPVQTWIIHKYLSIALGLTLLLHISSLLFDKFINFSWADILIPFSSNFKPLFLSLGIFGFYLILIIIFSSLFYRLKYQRAWRGIHYATYPLFIFSFVHGVFIGTDTPTPVMQVVYGVTGLVFSGLLIYRFLIYVLKKQWAKKS